MTSPSRFLLAICAGILVLSSPALAQAQGTAGVRQEGFKVDGFRAMFGVADAQDAKSGLVLGADLGLGTAFVRQLDLTLGTRWWKADLEGIDGKISDLSLHTDLHYHLFGVKGVRPYVLAGLGLHRISADVPGDASLDDALSGVNIGVDTGFGLATTRPGVGLRIEARRQFVEDAGNWQFAVGAGWWPRQRAKARNQPVVGSDPQAATWAPQPNQPPIVVNTHPQSAAPARDTEKDELVEAVRDLLAENRELRSSLETERTKAPPIVQPPVIVQQAEPVPPPPAPEPKVVEPEPVDPRKEVRASFERLAALPGPFPWTLRENPFSSQQTIGFSTGGSTMDSGAVESLRRLALVLHRHPDLLVRVEGHSDSQGNADANLTLSGRRAEVVRQELSRSGVDESRIRVLGMGSNQPIDDNTTPQGRARNRRAVVTVYFPDSQ